MKIDFFKYEGTGNDFVIIDNRDLIFQKDNNELIQNICDRKVGIGADGLILIENHDSLSFINDNAKFNAIDGIHESKIADGRISVKMNDVLKSEIFKYNDKYNTTFIDTGSPHLIRLYENIESIDIVKEARELKLKYSEYTDGLNINFCEISDSKIKLRTYERGVEDETLSCGTGAVASAVFLKDSGLNFRITDA